MKTKFYTYHQNNSGGSFNKNPNKGIDEYVIVEAESASDADDRAESIGLYFNGCNEGIDCSCCGDRWYPASPYDANDEPLVFSYKLAETGDDNSSSVFVHYMDGSFKEMFY